MFRVTGLLNKSLRACSPQRHRVHRENHLKVLLVAPSAQLTIKTLPLCTLCLCGEMLFFNNNNAQSAAG